MLKIQKNFTNSFMALLSLPATAMGFALSVQIAALSWILSTKYGFDIHEVGIVWAAGPLAGIIAQPIVGAISDNVWFWGGRRRPFILIGGILAALMLLALPNIDIIGKALGQDGATIGIAIAVALTLDLSINVSFNPTRSIIADVTPDGDIRTKGYTWMQTVSGTFGMLAYFIGAVLNNYILIYSGAVIVLIFSLFPPFFITEPKNLNQTDEGDNKASTPKTPIRFKDINNAVLPLWGFLLYGLYIIIAKLGGVDIGAEYIEYACIGVTIVLGIASIAKATAKESDNLEFQKILLAHAFTWWGVQTMFVYMFAYAKSEILGFGVEQQLQEAENNQVGEIISYSFLILNLVGAILPATILGPIAQKIGRVKTHTLAIAIMAVGYAGILFFTEGNVIMLYILMAVVGIGWASTISLPFAIMSERVDQSKMGLYMGIFNLSVVLPQLVASFKMGEIISHAEDKSIIFMICAMTLAISAVLWFFVKEGKQKSNKATTGGGGHH